MSAKWIPWVLAGILLLSTMGMSYLYAGATRGRDIAQANERAALDTTRTHLVDSLAGSSRLLAQAEVQADSLGRALQAANEDRDATAVALARTRVTLDSVVRLGQRPTVDTVEVQGSDTVRIAVFPMEGPPIEGRQTVRFDGSFTLDSRLTVSPFTFDYSLGCADSDAVLSWSVPEWVQADFAGGQVDPVVCNPPVPPMIRFDAGTGIAFAAGGITALVFMLAR